MSFINSTTLAMAGPGTPTSPTSTSTEAGLIGLGLGLPVSAMHVSAGSDGKNQGSYPEPIQRPKQPLVGLGLGLPTDELHTTFRVQPMIGLGIYVPDWEVVDDREEGEEVQPLPSPPLLPTRRESPYRIGVILDDDEFPPSFPIFTPPMVESPEAGHTLHPILSPIAIRPPFMTAPSASELPIPFAQQPSGVGLGLGLPSDEEADEPITTTTSSVGDTEGSSEPGTPRTPFVFHPVTPLKGSNGEFTVSEEECSEELIRSPAFTPYVPNVFSPTSASEAEMEVYYHLPSNLFASPDLGARHYKSPMDYGFYYEADTYSCS